MPTVFTHAAAAVLLGRAAAGPKMTARLCVAAAACSILPDLDAVGFAFGVRYGDIFGHRGFSHSILFAVLVGLGAAAVLGRRERPFTWRWLRLALLFAGIVVLHGLLDAMTDGGLGVAFFSPFSNARYFLPFRPIRVAPIGSIDLTSPHDLAVLCSELVWVWLPAFVLCSLAAAARFSAEKSRQARERQKAGVLDGDKSAPESK